jgi:hypothetical protein
MFRHENTTFFKRKEVSAAFGNNKSNKSTGDTEYFGDNTVKEPNTVRQLKFMSLLFEKHT